MAADRNASGGHQGSRLRIAGETSGISRIFGRFQLDIGALAGKGFGLDGRCGVSCMSIEAVLGKALEGYEISVDEGAKLFAAEGDQLDALISTADELRRRRVGDRVAYVINRNVNFTNVCVKRCGFCAFSRGHRAEQGYFLPKA